MGILNANKVGIPLGKLAACGASKLPASNAKGDFAIANMPRGEKVALKINHPDYVPRSRRERAGGRRGTQNHPGTGGIGIGAGPVEGKPAGHRWYFPVLVRNALPPNDTAVAETDAQGMFLLRLKPGNYVYQVRAQGCAAGVGKTWR